MRRKIWLAAITVGLVLGGVPSWAADNFYAIGAGGVRLAGTPISKAPYTIKDPGYYYLTDDLTLSSSGGTGITVIADNVTLNLMGYSLSYAGTYWSVGVFMNGCSNVEVRNGTVAGFTQDGIMENSASGSMHRVINVRVVNNSGQGIVLHGSGHLVENCTAAHNNVGIWVDAGQISGCVAMDNSSMGIKLQGPGSLLDTTGRYFYFGNGAATSILVDGNCAFGPGTNYNIASGTTGVRITANNAGTP